MMPHESNETTAPDAKKDDQSRVVVRYRGDERHIATRIETNNKETARRRGDFLIKKKNGKITIAVG
jgi:hypothetical protein